MFYIYWFTPQAKRKRWSVCHETTKIEEIAKGSAI
jgi:hypothetical protein